MTFNALKLTIFSRISTVCQGCGSPVSGIVQHPTCKAKQDFIQDGVCIFHSHLIEIKHHDLPHQIICPLSTRVNKLVEMSTYYLQVFHHGDQIVFVILHTDMLFRIRCVGIIGPKEYNHPHNGLNIGLGDKIRKHHSVPCGIVTRKTSVDHITFPKT